jgi:hypothetical protein
LKSAASETAVEKASAPTETTGGLAEEAYEDRRPGGRSCAAAIAFMCSISAVKPIVFGSRQFC